MNQKKTPLNTQVSYDNLLDRLETLEKRLSESSQAQSSDSSDAMEESLSVDEHTIMIANGILAGARELILRQDETKQDFTIAIVVLMEQLEL